MGTNQILNRFFTRNVFLDPLKTFPGSNPIFDLAVRDFVANPQYLCNQEIVSEIYAFMAKSYRNEYFYINTLLNKLLLGRHSMKTTSALTQIHVNKSKADFVLINGNATVYEIKTELDSFQRLEAQIRDYYKAFNRVCLVTSEKQYSSAFRIFHDSPVGIYSMTARNTISMSKRKEPEENNNSLEHTSIYKLLRKKEYEQILLDYYGELPQSRQVYCYNECLEWFKKIPVCHAHSLAMKQIKKRNQISEEKLARIPYELKALLYFTNPSNNKIEYLTNFLQRKYGG